MKTQYLRLAVLTVALAALAQTVHSAYAQNLVTKQYQNLAPEARVADLLQMKSILEQQGSQLTIEETKVLMDSMREAYKQMKIQLPSMVEKTESPTI